MRYMLDTSICIYIAKKKPIEVLHRFERLAIGDVGMSIITYGELLFGAHKSQHQKKNIALVEELAELIPPLAISLNASSHYGLLRATLEKAGRLIGNNDLWIASQALALDVILVTNNVSEFKRIPHLRIENWIDPK